MQPGGVQGFSLSGLQSTLGQVFAGLNSAVANMQRTALNIGGLQPVVNQLGSSIRSLIGRMEKQSIDKLPTAKAASEAYGSGLSGITSTAALGGAAAIAAVIVGIINSVKTSIRTVVDTLAAGFVKMKSIVLETVAAFRPFEVEMFNRAIKDLQAVFGTIFLPILQKVTVYVRQLADYFYSLPQPFKDTIGAVGKLVLIFGAVAIALTGIATVASTLATVLFPLLPLFGSLVSALVPLTIVLGPAIIPLGVAIAAIATGFALLATTAGALVAFNWSKIVKTFEQVWAAIEATAQAVWDQIKPIWADLKESFQQLSDQLGELFDAFKPLLGLGILAIALVIKATLTLIIKGLTLFVDMLTGLAMKVNSIARLLGLGTLGIGLPDVTRGQKSAFGLGQHGGSVTDISSAFKQVQEEVLKFGQGQGEQPEDKVGNIAKYTQNISEKMDVLVEHVTKGAQEGGEFLRKGPIRYALGKLF